MSVSPELIGKARKELEAELARHVEWVTQARAHTKSVSSKSETVSESVDKPAVTGVTAPGSEPETVSDATPTTASAGAGAGTEALGETDSTTDASTTTPPGSASATSPPTPPVPTGAWTDDDIARFIFAAKGKVDTAIANIRATLAWRQRYHIDLVLDDPFPDRTWFRQVTPHSYHGETREGYPVYIERSGAVDINVANIVFDDDLLVVRHAWQMEFLASRCAHQSAKHGRPISKAFYVFDLKNLSLKPDSHALSIFKTVLKMDQHHYPERLFQAFFINSPLVFRAIWATISPFIDPVTRGKFSILGSSYADKLLEHIAPDQLPEEYGGTCTCGTTYEPGHTVAPTCVTQPNTLTPDEIRTRLGLTTISLSAGQVDSGHSFELNGPSQSFFWSWRCASKDIQFSAVFDPAPTCSEAGTLLMVVPLRKRTKHHYVFTPPCPGTLLLTFDNSHSTWTSKTVYLRVKPEVTRFEARIRTANMFSSSDAKA